MDDQHKPEWIKVDRWDFVEYVDSLLRSQEAVDLEFKTARAGFPNSVGNVFFICRIQMEELSFWE